MRLLFVGIIWMMCFVLACNSQEEKPKRWLGDIAYDKKLVKKDFHICHGEENIVQYFNVGNNLETEGDKPRLINIF